MTQKQHFILRWLVPQALLQSALLVWLYLAVDNGNWPAQSPTWLVGLVTLTIVFPGLCYLRLERAGWRRFLTLAVPYSLLLSVLGMYIGAQQPQQELFNNDALIVTFVLCALITTLKLLNIATLYSRGEPITYRQLYELSWQHFIQFSLCCFFALALWLILLLGGELFSTIGIEILADLLDEPWVSIPVLTCAFAGAAIALRSMLSAVENIEKLLKILAKFLLPVLAVLAITFIASLPFTGLESLWRLENSTLMLLWMQASLLFFFNTVYSRTDALPYYRWWRGVMLLALLTLPLYAMLAHYGLWLRIEQYGLTVSRGWGVLISATLAYFAFSYCGAIIVKRQQWLIWVHKINVIGCAALFMALLAVNSPLANLQQLSAQSQVHRLQSGQVSADEFDVYYFYRELGKAGFEALQQIQQHTDNDSLKARIVRLYANRDEPSDFEKWQSQWLQGVRIADAANQPPSSLLQFIHSNNFYKYYGQGASLYLIAADVNQDQQLEWLLLHQQHNYLQGVMFTENQQQQWQSYHLQVANATDDEEQIKQALAAGEFTLTTPQWQHIEIGGARLSVPVNIYEQQE